jgi:hypothetical protein
MEVQRDQLSLINAHIEVPVNPAIAANVLPDGSVAYPDDAHQSLEAEAVRYLRGAQPIP